MDPDNILNEILRLKNVNIFIIRHAESEANYINNKKNSSFYYKIKYKKNYKNEKLKDSNLTGLGKYQVLRLKNFFINNNIHFNKVYCSPLIRTLETAYTCFFDTRDKLTNDKVIVTPLIREIIRHISDLPNDYNITYEKIINELNYKNFENVFNSEYIKNINNTIVYPPKRLTFSKKFDSDSYKDYLNVKNNCKIFWNNLLIELITNIRQYDDYEINIALYSHNGFLDILQKELLKRYSNKKDINNIINKVEPFKNTEVRKISLNLYNEYSNIKNNKINISINSIYKFNNRIE